MVIYQIIGGFLMARKNNNNRKKEPIGFLHPSPFLNICFLSYDKYPDKSNTRSMLKNSVLGFSMK